MKLSIIAITTVAILLTSAGCKKFLSIPVPTNSIVNTDALQSDGTTSGVLNGIYARLGGNLSGTSGLGYDGGLYTDELQNISVSILDTRVWYSNTITNTYGGKFWLNLYPQVATANNVIAAMKSSSLPLRNQWLGEALFLRALMYYYLVNMYGDVPLSLGTDFQVNDHLSRTAGAAVYTQMVADLKQAQGLLGSNYVNYAGNTTTDRARPNNMAVAALLARVYLYMGDWPDAEAQASAVIGNTAYKMETLANTFKTISQENIWGLLPIQSTSNTFAVQDAAAYVLATPTTSAGNVVTALSPLLINSFESGDQRLTNWIAKTITTGTPAITYYFAAKYKTVSSPTAVETLTLLRLAEQYLIRAEARAQQNNLTGAATDLNTVRARAALAPTTAATQAGLLAAILTERYHELFTEQGHRFFDLKRTGNVDAVMGTVAPQKGTTWSAFMKIWPIPLAETLANPNLTQAPGYQ